MDFFGCLDKHSVIALDGPVAAGKGTIGRQLASDFNLAYLDTGGLYRAIAFQLLREGRDLSDIPAMVASAQKIRLDDLENLGLRDEEIGKAASIISAQPALRSALLEYQRNFALYPPPGRDGVLLDGRDIGTVVCPAASVKFYITASVDTRAKRRFLELSKKVEGISLNLVKADLVQRDARDKGRTISPLTRAADAYLLDTTKMDIETAVKEARSIILAYING